jgi:hypothetical protein
MVTHRQRMRDAECPGKHADQGQEACSTDAAPSICTGFDVPVDPWTTEDIAFWTGSPRYQPWKDVAQFFRNRSKPARE